MRMLTLIAILLLSFTAQAEWTFETVIDEMTDNTTATITSVEPGTSDKWIAVRCEKGGTFLVFAFGAYFVDGQKNEVTTRFDSDEPYRTVTVPYPGRSHALLTLNDFASKLLADMQEHNKVIVRATPWRETPVTFTVNLSGFSKAYNQCLAAVQ